MRGFWGVIALVLTAAGLVLGGPSAAPAQDNATCLMCHSRPAMFQGRPDADSLVVSEETYARSVHGARGISCIMCHRDLVGSSFPHATNLAPPNCASCHFAVGRTFSESVHGYALSRGNPRAPTCATCHGRHNILPSSDPNSQTNKARLPHTCAQCHGAAGLLTEEVVRRPEMVSAYARSVHGQLNAEGDTAAASCSDCHGVHDLKGPNDPTSRVNPANIPATCGQCHPQITAMYNMSIHGRALATGVRDSPTCIDCHGEHLILSPENPESATCAAQEATRTCGPCHDNPVIVAKYNLQGGVVGSYVDSYHGWASRRGGCDALAATCDDCHTAHMVLPASDPASTINPANVAATCGRCHKNATPKFAASYTHETTSIVTNPVNRYIRLVYLAMIALVIGGMVVHNLLIMNYFMIENRRKEKRTLTIMRLDRSQVIQHAFNAVAFIGLVFTGFALRFPNAWWVKMLGDVGMTEELRGDLHRIFAVILVVIAFYHLYYILATRRGREEVSAMFPTWKDLTDAVATIRYYTWRTDKHASPGRYDYTQKAEYWALIWGTILMALTGFILWFPRQFAQLLPVWAIPAAQTIHYYEAWLATLAILVWHFFFVIFHPDVYPMSWTWMTGKMTEDTVKSHHGDWYDEMKQKGQLGGKAHGGPTSGPEHYREPEKDE